MVEIGCRDAQQQIAFGDPAADVHVPLGDPHDGDHVKAFAKRVAEALAHERPDDVVAEMTKSLRTGRVFVDWLQNDPTRQTVAPDEFTKQQHYFAGKGSNSAIINSVSSSSGH